MILKPPDAHTHEFLILDYPDIDFIVNRDQIFASLFLEETSAFESRFRYLSAQMEYSDHTLPVFDLDLFLKDIFDCRIEGFVKFALISEFAAFSEKLRGTYQQNMLQDYSELSSEYIAFKVSSHAKIRPVPLPEISLLPSGIRWKQNKEGILGCRFPKDAHMQFFLDIETIVFNSLL